MHLHFQGACEITHFSDMLQISRAASSQMIKRLVQQGVVHRFQSSKDRRVRLVDLTEIGKKVVLESMSARVGWINELVSQIPSDDHTHYLNMFVKLDEYANQLNQK
jgi:DNA-binding MarR family transcriptional regulator